MNQQIHWFPGHMAKSINEMRELVSLVDIILEIVDARAPLASRNPILEELSPNKPRILILSKKDLANDASSRRWLSYFKSGKQQALAANLANLSFQVLKDASLVALKEKFAKEKAKGLRPRAVRAMIVGIPNVGKSTLINRIAKRKATLVGNKPGITRTKQWIKVGTDFELLDTPGVLYPQFENQEVALKLALIGTIKEEILPVEHLIEQCLLRYYMANQALFSAHYDVSFENITQVSDVYAYLEKVGLRRGILAKEGKVDISSVAQLILKEFRDGLIGKITLEEPAGYGK